MTADPVSAAFKGILRDSVVHLAGSCSLAFVNLAAGGSEKECASCEVPAEGSVELICAPYQYEGLKEGRYLAFGLK